MEEAVEQAEQQDSGTEEQNDAEQGVQASSDHQGEAGDEIVE